MPDFMQGEQGSISKKRKKSHLLIPSPGHSNTQGNGFFEFSGRSSDSEASGSPTKYRKVAEDIDKKESQLPTFKHHMGNASAFETKGAEQVSEMSGLKNSRHAVASESGCGFTTDRTKRLQIFWQHHESRGVN
jgi:hypothetical protein